MSQENKTTFVEGLIIREYVNKSGKSVFNISVDLITHLNYLKANYNKDENNKLWSNYVVVPRKSITKGGITHTAIKDEYYSRDAEEELKGIASEIFEQKMDKDEFNERLAASCKADRESRKKSTAAAKKMREEELAKKKTKKAKKSDLAI